MNFPLLWVTHMANVNRTHELRGDPSGSKSLGLLYVVGALFVLGAVVAGALAIYAVLFN